MSVDNKKYKIALPDGRTTVWTQEQFDKQGEALLSKYPDANIIFTDYYEIRNGEKELSNLNLKIKRILLSPLRLKSLTKFIFIKSN